MSRRHPLSPADRERLALPIVGTPARRPLDICDIVCAAGAVLIAVILVAIFQA